MQSTRFLVIIHNKGRKPWGGLFEELSRGIRWGTLICFEKKIFVKAKHTIQMDPSYDTFLVFVGLGLTYNLSLICGL